MTTPTISTAERIAPVIAPESRPVPGAIRVGDSAAARRIRRLACLRSDTEVARRYAEAVLRRRVSERLRSL